MKLRAFIATFRLYRRAHSIRYALARAWHIEVQGSPF